MCKRSGASESVKSFGEKVKGTRKSNTNETREQRPEMYNDTTKKRRTVKR